jgi:hypothetical protein
MTQVKEILNYLKRADTERNIRIIRSEYLRFKGDRDYEPHNWSKLVDFFDTEGTKNLLDSIKIDRGYN